MRQSSVPCICFVLYSLLCLSLVRMKSVHVSTSCGFWFVFRALAAISVLDFPTCNYKASHTAPGSGIETALHNHSTTFLDPFCSILCTWRWLSSFCIILRSYSCVYKSCDQSQSGKKIRGKWWSCSGQPNCYQNCAPKPQAHPCTNTHALDFHLLDRKNY